MGEPGTGNAVSPAPEHIGCEEGTRGNDTSEYPEEKKESLDSLSSGERKGTQPKPTHVEACGRCVGGVVGPNARPHRSAAGELQIARVAERIRNIRP
jgi:hypothetical protein